MIKSVQKIENYRHVLNTDLDGGGVRCRWGLGWGTNNIEILKLKTPVERRLRWG